MLPLLRLGPLAIHTPGLALLAGVWVALEILSREAARLKLDAARVYNAAFFALVAGIVGARVAFVTSHWESYRRSPLSIFSITPGSELAVAGVCAGLFVGFAYLRRHVTRPGQGDGWASVLDALAPACAALAAFGSVANLLSGNGYGVETSRPWGIELWSAKRHPTQLYELAAALAVLAILWRRRGRWPQAGAAYLAFVILYGASRLFLEAFRDDSWVLPGSLRGTQVVALLSVTTCLFLVARRAGVGTPNPDERPIPEIPDLESDRV